jgi:hypothetical protein
MTATKTRPKAKTAPDHPFLTVFRSGMGVIESTVVGLAEFPLGVAGSLGISDETTGRIRKGHTDLVHGINGSVDSLATGITDVAGKQLQVVSDVLGGFGKTAGKS